MVFIWLVSRMCTYTNLGYRNRVVYTTNTTKKVFHKEPFLDLKTYVFTNDVVTIQKSVCGTRFAVDVAEFREWLPTRTVAPLDSCGRRAELATCDRNYKASNTEPLQISGSRVTKRLLGVDRPAAFAISPFRTGARQHGALSGGRN